MGPADRIPCTSPHLDDRFWLDTRGATLIKSYGFCDNSGNLTIVARSAAPRSRVSSLVATSALRPKADIRTDDQDVWFVPKADTASLNLAALSR